MEELADENCGMLWLWRTWKLFCGVLWKSVYWGSEGTIKKEFNKDAFIDCSDFATVSDVADYLLEIENNRDVLEKYLSAPVFLDEPVCDDELKMFLKRIVDKPEEKRIQRLSAVSYRGRKQEQMYKGNNG